MPTFLASAFCDRRFSERSRRTFPANRADSVMAVHVQGRAGRAAAFGACGATRGLGEDLSIRRSGGPMRQLRHPAGYCAARATSPCPSSSSWSSSGSPFSQRSSLSRSSSWAPSLTSVMLSGRTEASPDNTKGTLAIRDRLRNSATGDPSSVDEWIPRSYVDPTRPDSTGRPLSRPRHAHARSPEKPKPGWRPATGQTHVGRQCSAPVSAHLLLGVRPRGPRLVPEHVRRERS